MVTIKAKQTVADVFGKLNAGQTIQVDAEKANELEAIGLVDIISEDDGKPVPERVSKGVVIKDMTESGGGKVLYQSPLQKKELADGPGEEETIEKVEEKEDQSEPNEETKKADAAEGKKPEQKEVSKKQYGRK